MMSEMNKLIFKKKNNAAEITITAPIRLEGTCTVVSDMNLTPTSIVYQLWDLRELISPFQDSPFPSPKMGIIIVISKGCHWD